MSSNGNKYILRMHYNYQGASADRFPYNGSLDYAVRGEEYNNVGHLTALYDEEFGGNYILNDRLREKKVLLCGSLTRGYYKVSDQGNRAKLSFVTVYPEKISISSSESLKFAYGEIDNVTDGIYAKGSDTGLALQLLDKVTPMTWKMGIGMNKALAEPEQKNNGILYYYNSNRKSCEGDSPCGALIIPKKI